MAAPAPIISPYDTTHEPSQHQGTLSPRRRNPTVQRSKLEGSKLLKVQAAPESEAGLPSNRRAATVM